ncbi:hypothetical protein N7478_000485 [Penicillium angulare]|uniref:uncharacterized protein n=1 Tax=Penicillium angulare TaxID=116970 RepID=UPI00253FF04B|nr:uncharacterized protein N7478_000485 [Penicillium angulare]KAJ5291234.1 hypothetical protein N7478_000485 [Penicillium angulare]
MAQNHLYSYLEIPKDAPIKLKSSPGKGWGVFATRRIKKRSPILSKSALFVVERPHDKITEDDLIQHIQELSAHQTVQYLLLGRGKASYKDPETWGVFLLQSRFNHSCAANSRSLTIGGGVITKIATRYIAKGEEITANYDPNSKYETRKERHKILRFACSCSVCCADPRSQQLSDMRRRLIRGLEYLRTVDPNLKRDAENFGITLSSRFFYTVLTMFLLEEEKLLYYFEVDFYMRMLNKLATMFESERNSRIAQSILKEKTCLERLLLGFTLYGQEDATDSYVDMLIPLST